MKKHKHKKPFYITAYNARGEGCWVNLLDPDKNKKHTGAYGQGINPPYENVARLILQFNSTHQMRHILLKINGTLATPLLFFSPHQFQSDLIEIPGIRELKSLEVYLPHHTFSVHMRGLQGNKDAIKEGNEFKAVRQHCILIRNKINLKREVNLCEPELSNREDFEIFEISTPISSDKPLPEYKHLVISASKPDRTLLYQNKLTTLHLCATRDLMQFQADVLKCNIQENAATEIVTTIQPHEEVMFLFHD